MKETYRWGILGPGKMAHKFMQGLQVTENGRLYAVASREKSRADAFRSQYHADKSYGSYEDLLSDGDVDIVYIATPHHLHYELTKKCILAGKAVLCEKPATINLLQFDDVMSLAKGRGVFYMDALWTRFLPSIEKMLELIVQGDIGEVKVVRADFGFKPPYDPAGRIFNPLLGGGSILDIGIYPIFLSLLVLGYPTDIRVNAVMADTGVDAGCNMIFRYRGGAIANLLSTFLTETETSAEVAGTKGRIMLHRRWYAPTSLSLYRDGKDDLYLPFETLSNGCEYEAMEVMRCLDEGKLQSEKLPLSFTRELMRLMDEVRRQAGVEYAADLHA